MILEQDEKGFDLFTRQRRNLILSSLLLFFVLYYGLASKDINDPKITILGYSFIFATPVNVSKILIVAVLYFFLRYYQYFRSLQGNYVRSTLLGLSDDLLKKLAMKTYIKSRKKDGLKLSKVNEHTNRSNSEIVCRVPPYEVRIRRYVSPKDQPNQHKGLEESIKFDELSHRLQVFFCRWRRLIFNTPIFTEFILPIIFASLAVLFYILKTCNLV